MWRAAAFLALLPALSWAQYDVRVISTVDQPVRGRGARAAGSAG